MGQAIGASLTTMAARRVEVAPATTAFDPRTRTARVDLTNTSKEPLDVELAVRDELASGGSIGGIRSDQRAASAQASPLISADSARSPDSSPGSLVSWVTGLPSHVRLAPGEKKTITVKINVPASRAAGEYVGWLVATVRTPEFIGKSAESGAQVKVTLASGGPIESSARLVYRAE